MKRMGQLESMSVLRIAIPMSPICPISPIGRSHLIPFGNQSIFRSVLPTGNSTVTTSNGRLTHDHRSRRMDRHQPRQSSAD